MKKSNIQIIYNVIDNAQADVNMCSRDESLAGAAVDVQFVMSQVLTLLETASVVFNLLPNEVQEKVLQFHNEGTSINHCLRWGEQSAKDILKNPSAVAIDSSN